jgi:ubiquinone/menaquinone biosynthesis C-methylase UbiE
MNFWDDQIYSRRQQWNLWPYVEVLSTINNLRHKGSDRAMKLLEIGCGVGNNLIPLAEMGFDCYGIDVSRIAVEETQERARTRGLKIEVFVSDVCEIKFPNEYFDFIVDRSVLTCTDSKTISKGVSEVFRTLRKNGFFVAFDWFGVNHPDLNFGREISQNTFGHFTSGNFKNVEIISTFDFNRISNLLVDFSKSSAKVHQTLDIESKLTEEKFSFIARK